MIYSPAARKGTVPLDRLGRWYGVLLCLIFLVSAEAQSNDPGVRRRKLVPADYKGVPDESSNFLARTNVLLSFDYAAPINCTEKNRVRFQFQTRGSVSNKSWMKFNKIKSTQVLNELLSHEQGHYDINEIFAMDLKQKLSGNCYDKARYKTEIDSVFRSMNRYYDSLQLTYDAQTENMRNRELQAKWKQKIDVMYKNVSRLEIDL